MLSRAPNFMKNSLVRWLVSAVLGVSFAANCFSQLSSMPGLSLRTSGKYAFTRGVSNTLYYLDSSTGDCVAEISFYYIELDENDSVSNTDLPGKFYSREFCNYWDYYNAATINALIASGVEYCTGDADVYGFFRWLEPPSSAVVVPQQDFPVLDFLDQKMPNGTSVTVGFGDLKVLANGTVQLPSINFQFHSSDALDDFLNGWFYNQQWRFYASMADLLGVPVLGGVINAALSFGEGQAEAGTLGVFLVGIEAGTFFAPGNGRFVRIASNGMAEWLSKVMKPLTNKAALRMLEELADGASRGYGRLSLPLGADSLRSYVNSFVEGTIKTNVLEAGTLVYRYTGISGQRGSFYTTHLFTDPAEVVLALDLKESVNPGTIRQVFRVETDTLILEGKVANSNGDFTQYLMPDNSTLTLISETHIP